MASDRINLINKLKEEFPKLEDFAIKNILGGIPNPNDTGGNTGGDGGAAPPTDPTPPTPPFSGGGVSGDYWDDYGGWGDEWGDWGDVYADGGGGFNPFGNDDLLGNNSYSGGGGNPGSDNSFDLPSVNFVGLNSNYPGAIIIESSSMPTGSGVTIPPFIVVSPGYGNNTTLLDHEYGHILQFIQLGGLLNPSMGYALYLLIIGGPSLYSAWQAGQDVGHDHDQFYTEKWANQLSYWLQGSPSNWDFDANPVYWP